MRQILHITPFFRPNIGGVESHLDDLCRYLQKKGHFQCVLTLNPITTTVKAPKFEKSKNLEIHRFWWPGYNLFHKLEPYPFLEFLYLTPYLLLRSFLFLLSNHRKIDVIHAHGLNAAFVTKSINPFFRKRVIMSTYAVYGFQPDSIFAKIVRWTLNSFDEIQPLADPSKQELIRIGLEKRKLRPYYLWIDLNLYKAADKKKTKKRLGLEGKFVVLFVGRLIEQKGVRKLIKAAKQMKKITFVLIGDSGPLLSFVRAAANQSKNIILVEGVRGSQLVPYYQAADIFIIPSQYEEAFGKVSIEALACGTPVIGANKGAIPDVIDSSVGKIIKPTEREIKKAIEYLYSHSQVLSRLTKNSVSYARKRFSSKNAGVIERGYYD